jgi:coenzyme F420-reducing hydrogenase gamma subunit
VLVAQRVTKPSEGLLIDDTSFVEVGQQAVVDSEVVGCPERVRIIRAVM